MDDDDVPVTPNRWWHRYVVWWFRLQACRMAAQVMQGMGTEDEAPAQRLWSVTVFFEAYLWGGSGVTLKDFGPKEPVDFKSHQGGKL